MSFDFDKAMTDGVQAEVKRKGDTATIGFNHKKTMIIDGEKLTLKQGYDKFIVPFCKNKSPTIQAIKLIALAKRVMEKSQTATATTTATEPTVTAQDKKVTKK